jgi:bacterioferritin-associated ferredoxin
MDEIVCYCKNITKSEIEAAALKGAMTLREIRAVTGACTGNQCRELNPEGTCCSRAIFEILYNLKKGNQANCSCFDQ